MDEFKRMTEVSCRLKNDTEIPNDMRLKYELLNKELNSIGGSYDKLTDKIFAYRLLKNDSKSLSVFNELIDLKHKLAIPEPKNLFN